VSIHRIFDLLYQRQATSLATTLSQHLPQSFFARPAEQVAPDLIGCLLVKRQPTGELL
jgi:DNA-3-methyladenine glycosylase